MDAFLETKEIKTHESEHVSDIEAISFKTNLYRRGHKLKCNIPLPILVPRHYQQ